MLLDLKVKHAESLVLGSMTGQETLKFLALTLRDVPPQRQNGSLKKGKRLVRSKERRDRPEIVGN